MALARQRSDYPTRPCLCNLNGASRVGPSSIRQGKSAQGWVLKQIQLEIGGIQVEDPASYFAGPIGIASLYEDRAPRACSALWEMLPLKSRTIHTYRFGQCWRTEDNVLLLEPGEVPENPPSAMNPLVPGDLVYFTSRAADGS